MDCGRQDVELLAAIRGVAMADESKFLEDVERPVDRRGDRRRVGRAASFDKVGAGDVPLGPRQDLDQGPPLRRPSEPAGAKAVADARPVASARRRQVIRSATSCEV